MSYYGQSDGSIHGYGGYPPVGGSEYSTSNHSRSNHGRDFSSNNSGYDNATGHAGPEFALARRQPMTPPQYARSYASGTTQEIPRAFSPPGHGHAPYGYSPPNTAAPLRYDSIRERGKAVIERERRKAAEQDDRSSGLSTSFGGGGAGNAAGYSLGNYPGIDRRVGRPAHESRGEHDARSGGEGVTRNSVTLSSTQFANGRLVEETTFRTDSWGGDGLDYCRHKAVDLRSGFRNLSIGGANQSPATGSAQPSFPPPEPLHQGHRQSHSHPYQEHSAPSTASSRRPLPHHATSRAAASRPMDYVSADMDRRSMRGESRGEGASVASGYSGSSRGSGPEGYGHQSRKGRQHVRGDPRFSEEDSDDNSIASSQRTIQPGYPGQRRHGEAPSIAASDTTSRREERANSEWAREQRRRQSDHEDYR